MFFGHQGPLTFQAASRIPHVKQKMKIKAAAAESEVELLKAKVILLGGSHSRDTYLLGIHNY
jgi:hypothetical protein